MKILNLVVNGTIIHNVKSVTPPDCDEPYWEVILDNGGLIQATGIVTLEYEREVK
jgi:hypothetical protein